MTAVLTVAELVTQIKCHVVMFVEVANLAGNEISNIMCLLTGIRLYKAAVDL